MTPKQTKRSKRSTARIFWAVRWSSTKRVRSVKAEAPAADVAATVEEAVVVGAAVTAVVVAVAVEDEVEAADTVVVVVAEAAAIASSHP